MGNSETLKKTQKKFKDRIASDLVDILELEKGGR